MNKDIKKQSARICTLVPVMVTALMVMFALTACKENLDKNGSNIINDETSATVSTQPHKDYSGEITVYDEQTLREALLSENDVVITLNEDLVIEKQLNVAGNKTLTGSGKLTMQLAAINNQAVLGVRKDAVLKVKGITLDGNGISSGVRVYPGGELEYEAGKIEWTAEYGVVTEGKATLNGVTMYKNLFAALEVANGGDLMVDGCTVTNTKQTFLHTDTNANATVVNTQVVNCIVRGIEAKGGTIHLEDVTIDDAHHGIYNDGAVITGTNVTIKNIEFYGLAEVGSECKIELENSTITKCGNAGVYLEKNANIKLTGCTVAENENGAYILSGHLTVVNSDFTKNGATSRTSKGNRSGAAVRLADGTFTATDSIFNNNTANFNSGAGITVQNGTVELTNCEINGNKNTDTGKNAGAFHLDSENAVLILRNCSVKDNSTVGMGGAIFVNNAKSIALYDCVVQNNTGSTAAGGAVRLIKVGDGFVANNTKFINNYSLQKDGGAVTIQNAYASFQNCVFSGNKTLAAGKSGGAIQMDHANAVLVMSGCTVYNNEATGMGGAIFANNASSISLSGCVFQSNKSVGNAGGAIRVVKVRNGFTATNTKFIDNTCVEKDGGAVTVQDVKAVFKGCEFSGNKAMTTGKNAGALQIASQSANVTLDNCVMKDNQADCFGGAIFMDNGSLTIKNSKINNNTARKLGGAVRVVSGELNIEDSVFNGNQNTQGANGGALCIGAVTANIKGTEFSGNIASDNGGAISVESADAKLAISGCTFTGNKAVDAAYASGGALYILHGQVAIDDSVFDANQSKHRAGALLVNNAAVVEVTDCTFKNSTGAQGGGGSAVAMLGNGSLSFVGTDPAKSVFEGNITEKNGGAIFVNGPVSFENYTFTGNVGAQSSAIYVHDGKDVSVTDCTFGEDDKILLAAGANVDLSGKVTDATVKEMSDGTATICEGYDTASTVVYEPSAFVVGKTVAVRGENVSDDLWNTAIACITLPEDEFKWHIDGEGKLDYELTPEQMEQYSVAYITADGTTTYYLSFEEAFAAAVDGNTIVVKADCVISAQKTIDGKNIIVINEAGTDVTISRADGYMGELFRVNSGSLTIGSTDKTYTGTITIDGTSAAAVGGRTVRSAGQFTLGYNAALTGAFSDQAGSAVAITGGNNHLYGNVVNNKTSNAEGGVILVTDNNKLTIHAGTYDENAVIVLRNGAKLELTGALGAVAVKESGNASVTICEGYNAENKIHYIPASYTKGRLIIARGENVADDLWTAALAKITLPETDLNWYISNEGKLTRDMTQQELVEAAVAYITTGDTTAYYLTFGEAFAAAVDGDTIIVKVDCSINQQMTVENKNIMVINVPGASVKISRASGYSGELFRVNSGSLTIGSLDKTYTGTITLDGTSASAIGGRTVRSGAKFTLGYNATLTGANCNQAGAALAVTGGDNHLYGSVTNNKTSHTEGGGAVLVTGNNSLTIHEGTYSGNQATNGRGGVITVYDNAKITILGGTFENNTGKDNSGVVSGKADSTAYTLTISGGTFVNNDVYIKGTAAVSNGSFGSNAAIILGSGANLNLKGTPSNLTVKESADATVTVCADFTAQNTISYQPKTYTMGRQIVVRGENVTDAQWTAALEKITLPETTLNWRLDSNGKLTRDATEEELAVATITKNDTTTYYQTFDDAFAAASDGDAIVVKGDCSISAQMTVEGKNITVLNATGSNVTISRASGYTGEMFRVNSGSLTIGSVDSAYAGTITIDGASTAAIGGRTVRNAGGTFTLGYNATLQGANSNQHGAALAVVSGTTNLYGNMKNNTSSSSNGGGAILVTGGSTVNIHAGTYSGNRATGGRGGAIVADGGTTVNIYGGTFNNNASGSHGGAVGGMTNSTNYNLNISGGTFTNNQGYHGGAIFNNGTSSTISICNATFSGNQKNAGGQGIDIFLGLPASAVTMENNSFAAEGTVRFG